VTYVSFGELKDYDGQSASDSSVYVLRLLVGGVGFDRLSQPLEWVAAVGRTFGSGKLWGYGVIPYDIRGILIDDQGGGKLHLDVIVTFSGGWLSEEVFKKAGAIIEELSADERLLSLFPQMQIIGPPSFYEPHTGHSAWFELVGEDVKKETDFWRRQPLLWDHRIGDHGGTTDAWKDQHGVWIGTAEKRQRMWEPPAIPPLDVPPQTPPEPNGPGKIELKLLLGLLGIAAVGYFVLKGNKGARA
jgi:hypothetical protein